MCAFHDWREVSTNKSWVIGRIEPSTLHCSKLSCYLRSWSIYCRTIYVCCDLVHLLPRAWPRVQGNELDERETRKRLSTDDWRITVYPPKPGLTGVQGDWIWDIFQILGEKSHHILGVLFVPTTSYVHFLWGFYTVFVKFPIKKNLLFWPTDLTHVTAHPLKQDVHNPEQFFFSLLEHGQNPDMNFKMSLFWKIQHSAYLDLGGYTVA